MLKDELFQNRKIIGEKICAQIRRDGGRFKNAKYFKTRPYYDGAKKYKFSAANFLRLLASENPSICFGDPRWYKIEDIENNGWSLKNTATPELLEDWTRTPVGEQNCCLQEFYNASDILEKDAWTPEFLSLETALEFLQTRKILEGNSGIISLSNALDSIKKYAESQGADELTAILTVQSWLVESDLNINLNSFLPLYPEEILAAVEKDAGKIFAAMSNAQAVLKNLRLEKIIPVEESTSAAGLFGDLKIVYHGSSLDINNASDANYPMESILTGAAAFEFLVQLRAAENFSADNVSTWLEISYKNYSHGKILIAGNDLGFRNSESVANSLRERLSRYRRQILSSPPESTKYVSNGNTIDAKELLNRVQREEKFFQSVIDEFEIEEMRYLETHANFLP